MPITARVFLERPILVRSSVPCDLMRATSNHAKGAVGANGFSTLSFRCSPTWLLRECSRDDEAAPEPRLIRAMHTGTPETRTRRVRFPIGVFYAPSAHFLMHLLRFLNLNFSDLALLNCSPEACSAQSSTDSCMWNSLYRGTLTRPLDLS